MTDTPTKLVQMDGDDICLIAARRMYETLPGLFASLGISQDQGMQVLANVQGWTLASMRERTEEDAIARIGKYREISEAAFKDYRRLNTM